MLNRRGFLGGLLAAPAIIRTPGLLMPVKALPIVVGVNFGRDLGPAVLRLPPALIGQAFHVFNTGNEALVFLGTKPLAPGGRVSLIGTDKGWQRLFV